MFRAGFQQRFKDYAYFTLTDILHSRKDFNAALLQFMLIYGAVVSVTGKAVKLPDNHALELLLFCVCNHALEVRAFICTPCYGAVYIFPYHLQPLTFCKGIAIPQLSFYALLCLVV